MKEQLPDSLLEARKKKSPSHQDLTTLSKVHFTNIGRNERGEAIPASDILNRINKSLGVTTNLINDCSTQDQSAETITDEELPHSSLK